MLSAESQRFLHVLVVDDEYSFRLSMEMALKMSGGFVVESCDSGQTATEMMGKEQFDVVLLDHVMPEMSGIEVLQWMKQQGIQTPVLMITGQGSETVAVEAMKLGVYDYFRKDKLDIDKLALEIKAVHERYLLKKQLHEQEVQKTLMKEKQKELHTLQDLEQTVNSIGQLLEKSLQDYLKHIHQNEQKVLKLVRPDTNRQCKDVFADLRQGLEVIVSGVSSIRNISAMVTKKLNEIRIDSGGEDEQKEGGA